MAKDATIYIRTETRTKKQFEKIAKNMRPSETVSSLADKLITEHVVKNEKKSK